MLALLGGEPKDVREAVQAVAEGRIQTLFETQAINGSIYHASKQMSVVSRVGSSKPNASMLALRGELQRVEDRAGSIAQLTGDSSNSFHRDDRNSYDGNGLLQPTTPLIQRPAIPRVILTKLIKQSQHTQRLIHNTVDNIRLKANSAQQVKPSLTCDSDVHNIVKVLDVIGDIAEQTNLLALNAVPGCARWWTRPRICRCSEPKSSQPCGSNTIKHERNPTNDHELQEGSRNAIKLWKCVRLPVKRHL